MTPRRAATLAVNAALVLAIVGIITATWWPAVYVSPWFQSNRWVRTHLLGEAVPTKPSPPPVPAPAGHQ